VRGIIEVGFVDLCQFLSVDRHRAFLSSEALGREIPQRQRDAVVPMLFGHAVANIIEGTSIGNEAMTLVLMPFNPEKRKGKQQ
jgi:hypothetical protein